MIITLVLVLTIVTQLWFQYIGAQPPLKQRLGRMILAMTLPLTLILFLLFSKIQGPLWGLPGDTHGGRSGLSYNMAPGNIAQLALSDDIGFRVKLLDLQPAPSKLYWRGLVLTHFDGKTWTAGVTSRLLVDPVAAAVLAAHAAATSVRQQITIEPNGQRWPFALETPQMAPLLDGIPTSITADHQLRAARIISERVRYNVVSNITPAVSDRVDQAELQQTLALPKNYNPRTRKFVANLREKIPATAPCSTPYCISSETKTSARHKSLFKIF